MTTTNVEREKEFHNRRFTHDPRVKVQRFYAVQQSFYRAYDQYLMTYFPEKNVLELGCGALSRAMEMAHLTKHFTAIDISEVAIQQSTERAAQFNLTDKMTFYVMNAEELKFSDGTFDVVVGSGIIHHLNIQNAMKEVHRVLRPKGVAIFAEPLGHNPVINLFRKLTPKLRSPDEHPLLKKDLDFIQKLFPNPTYTFYALATPYVAFFPKVLHPVLLPIAEFKDKVLLKIPYLQLWAWFLLMKLEKT